MKRVAEPSLTGCSRKKWVKLMKLMGLPLWLSAYGSARWSTGSTADVDGNKTTFSQTYVVVGLTPIDMQF